MEALLKEMKAMSHEIKKLRQEVKEVTDGMDFINERFEIALKELREARDELRESRDESRRQKEVIKAMKDQLAAEVKERKELEDKVFSLVNPIEIEMRKTNIEINGLKEEEGEKILDKVKDIVGKVVPGKTGVLRAYRVGKKEITRKRTVVVQFENRGCRNAALQSRSNLKKIEESHGRLFFNENLPWNLKVVLGKANEIRKKKEYKYLWTRDGVIYVRKSEGSNAVVIRKMADVEKIV